MALLFVLAGFPSCSPHRESQGRDTTATYLGRTLNADFPDSVRVPAVIAAGEATLRERGYTITSRAATADQGAVEGRDAEGVLVRISAKVTGDGTRCKVTVQPWGDQDASRAILDAMLVRLGL